MIGRGWYAELATVCAQATSLQLVVICRGRLLLAYYHSAYQHKQWEVWHALQSIWNAGEMDEFRNDQTSFIDIWDFLLKKCMQRYIPVLTLILQGLPVGRQTRWRTWWKETTWFFSADSPPPWQTQAPHSTGSGSTPSKSPRHPFSDVILSQKPTFLALTLCLSGTSTTNMTTSQSGRPPSPPDTRESPQCHLWPRKQLSSTVINRHISTDIHNMTVCRNDRLISLDWAGLDICIICNFHYCQGFPLWSTAFYFLPKPQKAVFLSFAKLVHTSVSFKSVLCPFVAFGAFSRFFIFGALVNSGHCQNCTFLDTGAAAAKVRGGTTGFEKSGGN